MSRILRDVKPPCLPPPGLPHIPRSCPLSQMPSEREGSSLSTSYNNHIPSRRDEPPNPPYLGGSVESLSRPFAESLRSLPPGVSGRVSPSSNKDWGNLGGSSAASLHPIFSDVQDASSRSN